MGQFLQSAHAPPVPTATVRLEVAVAHAPPSAGGGGAGTGTGAAGVASAAHVGDVGIVVNSVVIAQLRECAHWLAGAAASVAATHTPWPPKKVKTVRRAVADADTSTSLRTVDKLGPTLPPTSSGQQAASSSARRHRTARR